MDAYKGSILIVDSEESASLSLAHKLEAEGYYCVTAANGDEALRTASTYGFDLLIVNAEGEEDLLNLNVLSQFNSVHPDIRVLMTRASAEEPLTDISNFQGTYELLIKPFDFDELSLRVQNTIDLKNQCKSNVEPVHQGPWDNADGRFISLSEAMNDGYVVIQDSKVIFANEKATAIIGYTPEETMGKRINDFLPSHLVDDVANIHKKRLQGLSVPQTYEITLPGRDGAYCSIELSVRLIEYKEKTAVSMVIRDISERKRAEQALKESEARYRLLAENVTDIIFTLDMNLEFTYASPSVQQQLGFTLQEIASLRLERIVTPSSMAVITQMVNEELSVEKRDHKDIHRSRTQEFELYRKDGSTIWTECKITFLRDNEGQPVGILGVSRNITERKRYTQSLNLAYKELKQIFNHTPSGMCVIDKNYTMLKVNDTFSALLGIDKFDALGRKCYEVIQGSMCRTDRCPLHHIVNDEDRIEFDSVITRLDGTKIPCFIVGTPFEGPDGNLIGIVESFIDITERKQAEEQLRKSEEKWRSLAENAPVMIMHIDQDGFIQSINRIPDGLGQDADTVIGQSAFDFISEKYRAEAYKVFTRVMKTGITECFEMKGAYTGRWYHTTVGAFRQNNEIVGLTAINVEITDRKQTEKALRDGEEKYRELVELLQEGIWMIDENNCTSFVNPAMASMLGYTEGEMLGRHLFSFMDEAGIEIAKHNLERRRQGIMEQHDFEFLRKDGTRIYTSLETTPVLDEEGNYRGALAAVADITPRRKAEQELAESEERYRDLFENANDLIQSVDKEGKYVYVNSKWQEVLGYSKEELANMTFLDVLHKDQVSHCMELFGKLMQDEQFANIETVFVTKSGQEIIVEGNINGLWKNGEFVATRGIFRDISERKRLENELRKSEEHFRALIENSLDAIVVLNHDGSIRYVSPSYKRVLGYDPDERVGGGIVDHLHPDDIDKATTAFAAIFNTSGEVMHVELRVRHQDGSWRWIEARGFNHLENPAVAGIVVNMHDITERKKAEDALRESEERFREMAEMLPEVVFEMDTSTRLVYANRKAFELFGYSSEDMNDGMHGLAMIIPDERTIAAENVARRMQGEQVGAVEYTGLRKDGSTFPILLHTNVIEKDGLTAGFRGIIVDITERKKALDKILESEEQLRRKAGELFAKNQELNVAREQLSILNENLEQRVKERTEEIETLIKQKDEFIDQLGHDLKNPLTPLVTLLPIITKREQDTRQKELLNTCINNVNYMKDLVIKIIQLARLSSNTTTMKIEPVNLAETIDRLIASKKQLLQRSSIKIISSITDTLTVEADRLALQELLDNLLSNAVKFTPKGGTVTVDSRRYKGTVTVAVTDTGIGMTEEQATRVFDEFYKADQARHELDSSGLGLSICKRIVEKLGGTIWAESEGLDKGSTFYFTLKHSKKTRNDENRETARPGIRGLYSKQTVARGSGGPSREVSEDVTQNTQCHPSGGSSRAEARGFQGFTSEIKTPPPGD